MPEQQHPDNARKILEQMAFCIDTLLEENKKVEIATLLDHCKLNDNDPHLGQYGQFAVKYKGLKLEYLGKTAQQQRVLKLKKIRPYVKEFLEAAALVSGFSILLHDSLYNALLNGLIGGSFVACVRAIRNSKRKGLNKPETAAERKAKYLLEAYSGQFTADREGLIKDTLYNMGR